MVRPIARALCLLLVVPATQVIAQGPRAVAASLASLPVTRVILYKTGVGYFEHVGRVTGNQQLSVPFTGDQLDDVLKSLTTVDLGAGRVVVISYDSPTPVDRRLQALRVPLPRNGSTLDFLNALRGSRIEVRSGTAVPLNGRLLQAERRQVSVTAGSAERDELTLVTDAGVIATVPIDARTRVRVADADVRTDVNSFLGLTTAAGDRSPRTMVISTAGTGTRPFMVSYVSEAAVWKTTYRLVFPETGASRDPILQGWAVVDNLSAADWNNVQLSLVAGAPQAFTQPLSQPLFARRPRMALATAPNVAPQLHEAALEETAVQSLAGAAPSSPPPVELARGDGAGSGVGTVGGVVGGISGGVTGAIPGFEAVQLMSSVVAPAAVGSELGDLFEYRISDRVTIRRNQSALVPIIQAPLAAERVSVWNSRMGLRPRRAVWLKNTSPLTLDGGSVSIIDAGAFAGEGVIESIKPGERRLVSYAADLAVQVASKPGPAAGRISRVMIADGILTRGTERQTEMVYTIRNNDAHARTVVIEHPINAGWRLAGGVTPAESTDTLHRFTVMVAPAATSTLHVTEARDDAMTISVAALNAAQLLVFVEGEMPRDALIQVLAPIFAKRSELAALTLQQSATDAEMQRIAADQQRLRENMTALGRSSAERRLLQRYATELERQESRLDALKRDADSVGTAHQRVERELSSLVAALSFDRTF